MWRCCWPRCGAAGWRFLWWVDVVTFLLAFVTCVFLLVFVFSNIPAVKFFLVDRFDKPEAEIKLSFAGTSRTGDEQIHIRIYGLAEIDCPYRDEGRAECRDAADEDKASFMR